MYTRHLRSLLAFGLIILSSTEVMFPAEGTQPQAPTDSTARADSPPLRVAVDPRVELMSVIFRLAGNPEYSQGKVASYVADVEKHFGPQRNHDVIVLARQLRRRCGVSYDACMSMAAHLRSADDLRLTVPLEPWPEGLDRRWTASDVARFLEAAGRFVKDAAFNDFLRQHKELYQTTEARLRDLMEREGHLEWFKEYFGERPRARFNLVPALLNGGACYGARSGGNDGQEVLYCMLGVWQTDSEGLPEFTKSMLSTIVHEFGHSYANPVIGRHMAELKGPGETLFRSVSSQMRAQAYGNAQTMLHESLVRACEVRYALRYDGQAGRQRAISYNQSRGFLWISELSDLLGEYEAHRQEYRNLDAFAPRLVTFFQNYARTFPDKQKALEAKRPKVVSMIPANGTENADPKLTAIQVVFDRPMRGGSWAVVGGGPHYPEGNGTPSYDATRTTWTFPVTLKPDWEYQFMLNSGRYQAFCSQEGVPLEPVQVKFKTGKQDVN